MSPFRIEHEHHWPGEAFWMLAQLGWPCCDLCKAGVHSWTQGRDCEARSTWGFLTSNQQSLNISINARQSLTLLFVFVDGYVSAFKWAPTLHVPSRQNALTLSRPYTYHQRNRRNQRKLFSPWTTAVFFSAWIVILLLMWQVIYFLGALMLSLECLPRIA